VGAGLSRGLSNYNFHDLPPMEALLPLLSGVEVAAPARL
jgi:hypothetical protein